MTEALRRAIAQIEQLPEPDQNVAAEKIQHIAAELAEQRWDDLLSAPRSEAFFDQMLAEIEEAKQAGTLLPWPHMAEEGQ